MGLCLFIGLTGKSSYQFPLHLYNLTVIPTHTHTVKCTHTYTVSIRISFTTFSCNTVIVIGPRMRRGCYRFEIDFGNTTHTIIVLIN